MFLQKQAHTVAQAFPFSVHTQRVSFSCASNGLSVPTFELHDLETNLHTVSLVHAPARSLSILFLKNSIRSVIVFYCFLNVPQIIFDLNQILTVFFCPNVRINLDFDKFRF